jgi:molecular chaperone DnaK
VEVTFDIDANGILNVTAKDLATSKESKITISANTKLSKDDIERLKKESEQFAEQDKKKRDEAEVKNEADNLIYTAEKLTQQDLKDKIKPEQVEKVNNSVKELKEAVTSNNIEEIKKKIEGLKNIVGEISTEAYRAAGAAASQQATSSQNSESASQPADNASQPADNASQPADNASQPADNASQPADNAKQSNTQA